MSFKKENKDFSAKLSNQCGLKEVMELPSNILFEFDKVNSNRINVLLTEKAVIKNMQHDDAAFEGWILAIILKGYNKIDYSIYLDVTDEFEKHGKNKSNIGTYNRILYRINRFSKQFDTFVKISPKLKALSDTLYIFDENNEKGKEELIDKIDLVVNRPDKDAGINQNPEIMLEALFHACPDSLLKETEKRIGKSLYDEINRQLPVGVFNKKVEKDYMVFTAGHAAIDLWSLSVDNEDLCIYELKKPIDNNKVGIVSELFFYANLMYDLYCVKNRFGISSGNLVGRGFQKIIEAQGKIKRIHAFFLVKELHKEIKDVVSILNQNTKIDYQLIKYDITFK